MKKIVLLNVFGLALSVCTISHLQAAHSANPNELCWLDTVLVIGLFVNLFLITDARRKYNLARAIQREIEFKETKKDTLNILKTLKKRNKK